MAGTKNIVEIHGNIRYARCEECKYKKRWDRKDLAKKELPLPVCPECKKNLLRPDVVWFGELLDQEKWQKAMTMVLDSNILLVIGTSGVVQPVASLPQYAKMNKAKIIEFNIEETPLSPIADLSFFGPCEETLPEFTKNLINFLKKGKSR
ncbi:MAG: SIR2 family NAD-dependent protein deacylase [Candidatus Heimdallarchaeaceae archaeon]